MNEEVATNLLGARLSVIHQLQRTARKIYRFVTKSSEYRTDSIKVIYASLLMLNSTLLGGERITQISSALAERAQIIPIVSIMMKNCSRVFDLHIFLWILGDFPLP